MKKFCLIFAVLLSFSALLAPGMPVMPAAATRTWIDGGTLSLWHDCSIPAEADFVYTVWYIGYTWEVELYFSGEGQITSGQFGVGSYAMTSPTCISSTVYGVELSCDGTLFQLMGSGWGQSVVQGGKLNEDIDIKVIAACSEYCSDAIYTRVKLTTSHQGGGGCPYAAAWDGEEYVPENNLLMTSERYWPEGGTDVQDYYRFINPLVADETNHYRTRIVEFENEHSYIDQVKLWTVDHSPGTHVAVDSHGTVLTYIDPTPPLQARDSGGTNVKEFIKKANDDKLFEGQPGDTMTLLFPTITEEQAKLVLYADDFKESIHVQVLDEGEWVTVEEIHPRAANFNWEIADVSPHITFGAPLAIRLLWTDTHVLDFVGLDTSPQQPLDIQTLSPIAAVDNNNIDIMSLIATDNENYAEIIPTEYLTFLFDAPTLEDGQVRDWILFVDGYYVPYTPN